MGNRSRIDKASRCHPKALVTVSRRGLVVYAKTSTQLPPHHWCAWSYTVGGYFRGQLYKRNWNDERSTL